jgi:hypothetical protein
MNKYWKKILKFFRKNPSWNTTAHFMIGIGVGFFLAHPTGGVHPVRWGIAFIVVGSLIHLMAAFEK